MTDQSGGWPVSSNHPGPADDGRFRLLFEHSSDAHLIFDAGGITDCNPAAARVQQAFLPAVLPDTTPVRVAWAFRPCEELGGDLLNMFPIGDGHLGLYLLDVSGHGVPASLLAVAVGHALNPHGDPAGPRRPAEVARRVNERLCRDRTEQFVTLFYGVLDLDACTLTYANPGPPGPGPLSPGAEPV